MLTFEEGPHVYRWHGHVVPSVTQLLAGLHTFAGVPAEVMERAQRRGTFVHRMCELYDRDDLLEDDPDLLPYLPYLSAWKNFLRDYEPNFEGIEEQGFSEKFRFAGTLDRRGVFGCKHPGLRFIGDIKTSEDDHWTFGIQTSAYRQIVLEKNMQWAIARRCTIQLWKTGQYQLLFWDSPDDWTTFAALLHLHHRVQLHGKTS